MRPSTGYKLYGEFGDRYDLHTPAKHYSHDHSLVIQRVREAGGVGKVLDIGCGTGILLEKALASGLDPLGIDVAPEMLQCAQARVGKDRARLVSMHDLDFKQDFDAVVSLSWSINYCATEDELRNVFRRCYCALRPGGLLILQVAHAGNARGEPQPFTVDREPGPGGPKDIQLSYRFWTPAPRTLIAEYRFSCMSTDDHFDERHELGVANAYVVAAGLSDCGFEELELLNNWRGGTFGRSLSPFVIARRPRTG